MIIHSMKCSLTLMILYFSALFFAGFALAEQNQPNILVLNSYHQGENWTDNEIKGIFSEFQTKYPALVPLVETLDTKRYPSPSHLDFLKEYLLRKYRDRKIDLIIALDNPALNLITQNPTELFPDVPVIFAGINGFLPEMIADRKKITGVMERQDVAGTLKMALAMHPRVTRIFAVHDYTASGLAVRQETEAALAQFAGKLQISYSTDVPFETLRKELKEMPEDGLVLILTYVTDKAGHTFTREESTRLISSISLAPVYAMHETRLGFGIMGGLLLEGKEHGRQAARLAFRVLQGEDPDRIAVEESHSRSILDYKGLRRFQIPEDRWPKDALIINRPVSFWSLHKNVLIPSIVAIIALLGLSSMLLGAVIRLRHAKKAIHKSEEKYRVLFNSFPMGITVSDQDGKIVETNAISSTLLGVPREEQETRKVDGGEWRIIRTDGAPMPVGEYASTRALREKRLVENIEMGIVKPDAGITWLSVTAAPLNLENFGVVVTYLDVTARREAEEELRKRESLFRTLVNTIPDLIWLKDTDGVYLSCNKNFERCYGANEADILGKTDYDFVGKELADFFRENDRKAIAAGGPNSNEEQITFADDGHTAFLETIKMPMVGADGKLIGVLGIGRDITDRKQAEEAANEASMRLSFATKAGGVGVWEYDIVNNRLQWEEQMYALYGIGRETFGGAYESWRAGVHSEDITRVDREVEMALRGEECFNTEFRVIWPDGMVHHIQALATVLNDADGKPLRMIGTNWDITERKRAEAERENLQSQLSQAQKMESVGRLAGGVAHDFNNMLGIILGYADMILEQMDPDHPFHDKLMEIRKAGERSADLTRQLLAFARKQTVAPKVIDLNDTLEGMLKLLMRLIGEDIDLAWRPGKEVWPVHIDPAQVDQILANLCVNARDAIAGVGKVTIETGNTIFDEDYCRVNTGFVPGEYAMLAVSDNGCGMDSETLSHLFEPFFTTKELGKGTGLGLATVYGIVMQNNAFINVYSEPGQGTTFKIYLRRHLDKAVSLTEKGPDRTGRRGHETVLLVEDEPAILRMTILMLKREGYTVIAAGAPGEAIRLANEHSGDIHLLMTDVVMPEMNGRELAKNILSLYPHLKCLFMSGYTADVIAHHGVLNEGVNFIQKPFSLQDLGAKLREVLDRE